MLKHKMLFRRSNFKDISLIMWPLLFYTYLYIFIAKKYEFNYEDFYLLMQED